MKYHNNSIIKYTRDQVYKINKNMHESSCTLPIDYTREIVYNIYSKRLTNSSKIKHRKGENKMSQNEIASKIEQLKEWEAILEEAQAEVEALRDCIKAQMLERGTEELQAGTYIIRWTSVLSNRFDSTAFKKEYAELYQSFIKQVSSRRFTIA